MGRGLPVEQLFSENVDRLISGQEVRDVPETEQDLKTALDFARLMRVRRPQPAPQFQANLKARLLQKLAQQEAEMKPNWFLRLIPRQPLWQAVAVLAVILVISGAILGIVLNNGGSPPVVSVPTITSPAVTTTTAAATTATTTAAPTTTTPPVISGLALTAQAFTNKTVYAPGERVVIQVNLKNSGSQPMVLTQFPPILSLMSAAGDPVLSFLAGQTGRTLAAGETATFQQEWNQIDAKGRSVPAGVYHLELEDIDLAGQTLKVQLSQPVSFEIK